MHDTGIQLLNLMFREGETICVSPNKYGWHSIPLKNAMSGRITLVPPEAWEGKTYEESIQYCDSSELKLVALNPIKGFRDDANCQAFRNFLIELDDVSLQQQLAYIKNIGMPYSAAIFSGGKSFHFLISLKEDLPNEKVWRNMCEWILNIVTWADQKTKNPSRSIRIPGAKRDDKTQILVEYKGAVDIKDLGTWLTQWPNAKPVEKEKRPRMEGVDPRLFSMKEWVQKALTFGLDPTKGRNQQWFSIACEFALTGSSEEDTIDILGDFFVPDRDFKEREWETSVKSAFKYIYENRK